MYTFSSTCKREPRKLGVGASALRHQSCTPRRQLVRGTCLVHKTNERNADAEKDGHPGEAEYHGVRESSLGEGLRLSGAEEERLHSHRFGSTAESEQMQGHAWAHHPEERQQQQARCE